jgi:hypothetical protein
MKKRGAVVFAVPLVVAVVLFAACKKETTSAGSGALDATDNALFQYLPAGSTVLAGGNYMKLQNFMQSGVAEASAALADKLGPGMAEWTKCFGGLPDMKKMRIAMSLKVTGMDAQLRMVLSGATVDDIAGCAQKANFKTTVDPDRKFIAVELPQPAANGTYLVLASGALYFRQGIALGAMPKMVAATRTELEGDIAALGKTTAADDAAMTALIAKVDRTKTVWLVGHGDGTPLAEKVGNVWGTFDISSGLAIEFTVQLKVADDAKSAEEGFAQLRKSADQLPGDLKDVVKGIQLARNGNDLHVAAKVSDAQIKSLAGQFAGLLGGAAMGGGR